MIMLRFYTSVLYIRDHERRECTQIPCPHQHVEQGDNASGHLNVPTIPMEYAYIALLRGDKG